MINGNDSNCFGFCSNSTQVVNHFENDRQDVVSLMSREDQREKKELDSSLSAALNGLTFHEREELQEVLHGVDKDFREDASFIESTLSELDEHLMHYKSGTALGTAEKMNSEYVSDMRLMFLRSYRYDAKIVALRMSLFFEMKQKLFGKDKLVKDITLTDLNEDDLACLRTGFLQIAGRDRSNRLVIVHMPGLRAFKTLENELRSRYYLIMQALKSDETQLRGVVIITYLVGDLNGKVVKEPGYYNHMLVMKSVPIHIVGMHMCCSDPRDYLIGSLAIKSMPAKLRARFRIHRSASHLEHHYYLMTYGIPPSIIPLTVTNDINLDRHHNWIQSCLVSDICARGPTTGASLVTIQPNSNDVLYLGWKKSKNMGNDRLRALVSDMSQKYDSETKENKGGVIDEIIAEIKKTGGRFLKQVNGKQDGWEVVPMNAVRKSITQMFRNRRKRQSDAAQNSLSCVAMIIDELLPDDVAFGSRVIVKRNRGTELLYQLISERSEEYEALGRNVKSTVADAIVQRLKSEGGRLLQLAPDKTGWIEISDNEARARVSKYFRNHRRNLKK